MENKKRIEKIPSVKIKLKKNNSPRPNRRNYYGKLTSKKKIESEIHSMSKENRCEFLEALSKHNFNSEIFIPRAMNMNKNEYKDKNYLLNELVSFEIKSQERKKIVEPLKKETNRFSRQYQLIKIENQEHQKDYIKRLENFYKDFGYSGNSIEYQMTENIFSPSSVLDHNFGVNIHDDVYKYSNNDFKNDYSKDQNLLMKWKKGVEETKENKNRAKKNEIGEEILTHENFEELREKEKEKEMINNKFQKKLSLLKNNLVEENRIRNMSRKEYFHYNNKLKKEIQNTKNLIEQLDNETKRNRINNRNNSFFNLNKMKLNLNNNKIEKTYKIIHPKENKNYKEKIVYASLDVQRRKPEKKNKIPNVKKQLKNYLFPNDQLKKMISEKSPICLTENNIFISSDNNRLYNSISKKDFLPKIPFMDGDPDHDNNITNDVDNTKKYNSIDTSGISTEKQMKKIKQIKELDHLYHLVYDNKNNFFEQYPHKSIEKYFKKYTKKKIPIINFKKGSNIHGLLDDLQEIVQKKDFCKIAESSNEVKNDLINKRTFSRNRMLEEHNLDIDKIQELDEKIPHLHYYFAENLLTIRPKDNKKKKK
jgi:hypothetical protein